MINWRTLSYFGNHKLINKSYIYLFFVPVIAKLLSKINSPLDFIMADTKYSLVLSLPFSWQMFFFGAFFFTLGTIVYNLFVPKIIRENQSYGSFLIDNKEYGHLVDYLDDLGIHDNWYDLAGDLGNIDTKPWLERFWLKTVKGLVKNREKKIELCSIIFKVKHTNDSSMSFRQNIDDDLKKDFWLVYNFANNSKEYLRTMALVFYSIGLVLIAIVLFQGLQEVIKISLL